VLKEREKRNFLKRKKKHLSFNQRLFNRQLSKSIQSTIIFLSCSTGQTPSWERDRFSASQEIPRIVRLERMQPEGSFPYSQEPATCPYPEPVQSSLCL